MVKTPVKPGRPKGAKNRASVLAKDNIDAVFTKLGGVDGMLKWAKANPSEFYTRVYTRLVAVEVSGAGPNGEHLVTPVLNLSLTDESVIPLVAGVAAAAHRIN